MESDLAETEQGKDAATRLTYEIFSILESKFLFGRGGVVPHQPSLSSTGSDPFFPRPAPATTTTTTTMTAGGAKVCALSIDGGARPVDGLLAAAALVRLEAALRRRAGKDAHLADFFDVAAGSGAGGVLAAMLFARGPLGRPMCSAEDALAFLLRRVRRGWSARGGGLLRVHRTAAGAFARVFGELTLRDTVRPVLVPCYDLATRAPFLFSRADANESPAHDFRLRDVCAATCAGASGPGAVEVKSVDGATRIAAVGSGVALGNPTAAAITHVLNNRREFPAAASIDDLLVMSIGTGEVVTGHHRRSKPPEVARIAAEGVSDMVDQAVAMAFGQSRTSNYVRIQGTGSSSRQRGRAPRTACGGETKQQAVWKAEAMLLQKGVESVLFQGRRLAGETNAEKLERFARELAAEHGRRKQQAATASPGAAVVPPPAPVRKQPTPAAPQTTVTAASASAVVAAATEAAAAAHRAPSTPRWRRRTAVALATKRAPGTSSSSHGARKATS